MRYLHEIRCRAMYVFEPKKSNNNNYNDRTHTHTLMKIHLIVLNAIMKWMVILDT